MLLNKLAIKNFMMFEELDIPILRRVNLIAGKNNSGKTTLLDAIRIVDSGGDITVVNHVLATRFSYKSSYIESYEGLFNEKSLKESSQLFINDYKINREIKWDGDRRYLNYSTENAGKEGELIANYNFDNPRDSVIYVPFSAEKTKLKALWENIVLTPSEDDVYQILKETIEPDLIRIAVGDPIQVRLGRLEKPVPLGTLGDGIYRIFLVALSLVNAKGKTLLIDEVELGLHYSAMETLWKMIFKYAIAWDIQVFITTHSQDAIKTFCYVASKEEYIEDAEYIRLQIGRKGKNEAIIYDGNLLRDSLDLELEIR